MLADLLSMTDIGIVSETTTIDENAEWVTTTTTSYIGKGLIYQAGQGANRYMSNKVFTESSHVLVFEPSSYAFTGNEKYVTHGGKTYEIQGKPEDVMEYGEIMVVGLRLQE